MNGERGFGGGSPPCGFFLSDVVYPQDAPQLAAWFFIRTSNEYKGSLDEIMRCWSYAENMVRESNPKFSKDEITDFIAQMREKAFPAVHHSEIYEDHYHPAYRVVALSILSGWREVKE